MIKDTECSIISEIQALLLETISGYCEFDMKQPCNQQHVWHTFISFLSQNERENYNIYKFGNVQIIYVT